MLEVDNRVPKVDYKMPEEVDFKIAMVAQPRFRYQFSDFSQETNFKKPLDLYG